MSIFPDDLLSDAAAVVHKARLKGIRIAMAESCTGGLVAALLTETAGSSAVIDSGFVTYSNASKSLMIGVAPEHIASYGAVSQPVARAMATGALAASNAHLTVAITGVAGPGGGSAEKPVGLVHFATALRGGSVEAHVERYGEIGRSAVRLAAVRTALGLLAQRLD